MKKISYLAMCLCLGAGFSGAMEEDMVFNEKTGKFERPGASGSASSASSAVPASASMSARGSSTGEIPVWAPSAIIPTAFDGVRWGQGILENYVQLSGTDTESKKLRRLFPAKELTERKIVYLICPSIPDFVGQDSRGREINGFLSLLSKHLEGFGVVVNIGNENSFRDARVSNMGPNNTAQKYTVIFVGCDPDIRPAAASFSSTEVKPHWELAFVAYQEFMRKFMKLPKGTAKTICLNFTTKRSEEDIGLDYANVNEHIRMSALGKDESFKGDYIEFLKIILDNSDYKITHEHLLGAVPGVLGRYSKSMSAQSLAQHMAEAQLDKLYYRQGY